MSEEKLELLKDVIVDAWAMKSLPRWLKKMEENEVKEHIVWFTRKFPEIVKFLLDHCVAEGEEHSYDLEKFREMFGAEKLEK